MRYHPIFVRLDGRRCVVIGGGEVAERKVVGLLRAEAAVTVISPGLTARLEELAAANRILPHRRRYRRGDLRGAFLAYAATGDEEVSAEVAREAAGEGVLLSAVDSPGRGNFIAPAVVERGDLVIAISTGGASPLMARRIRERIEREFGPEYTAVLRILHYVREGLAREGRNGQERRRIFSLLVDSSLLDHVRAGEWAQVDQLLSEAVGDGYAVENIRGVG